MLLILKYHLRRLGVYSRMRYFYGLLFAATVILCYNYFVLVRDTGFISPIAINNSSPAHDHKPPLLLLASKSPSHYQLSTFQDKFLEDQQRFNLSEVNVLQDVSPQDFYSVFNPRSSAFREPLKDKLAKIAMKNTVKEESFGNFVSHDKSKVKIPSFFIENYLLGVLDNQNHQLSEELKAKITKLRKKKYGSCTVTDRFLPLVYKQDYRFTLAIYLAHVNHHLSKQANTEGPLNLEDLSLPFNWYDFTDLSVINEDIKLHFFVRWLVDNHQSLPEKFQKKLMSLYYDEDPTESFLNERFNKDRETEGFTLNNFEMFLREFNREINSCTTFVKTDDMSVGLIRLIEDLYRFNFPHLDAKNDKIENANLQMVIDTDIKKPRDPEKTKQILQRNDGLTCKDYDQLPETIKVSFSDFLSDKGTFQPPLGYNVHHGTRDKFHLTQRLMYAKSYLYNYNGINDEDIRPLKITLLGGDKAENVYEFKINQFSSKHSERLTESGLVDSYISNILLNSGNYTLETLLEEKDNIYVDFLDQYSDLTTKYPLQTLETLKEFESEDEINTLIDYTQPKNEFELYDDSFVNIDSADVILKFHSRVPNEKFKQTKTKLQQNLNEAESLPTDMVYENLFRENLNSSEFQNPLRLSRNLFKYYKSVKFSNGFVDIKKVPKYFFEVRLLPEKPGKRSPNTGHYDWRFFTDSAYEKHEVQNTLSHLMQNWLLLTNKYQLKTWLAHGTLFSWYFNAKNFPWDLDMDVQMPVKDLNKLCLRFNQSLVMESPTNGLGLYFLDCGSSITHRSKENGKNNIDARLVDTKTGFYIDITGISYSGSKTPDRYLTEIDWNTGKFRDYKRERKFYSTLRNIRFNEGYKLLLEKPMFKNLQCNLKLKIVNCRNNHFIQMDKLLPLRKTLMEGGIAYVPNNYESILFDEYKDKWRKPFFNSKIFVPKLGNWIQEDTAHNIIRRFIGINFDTINKSSPDDNKYTQEDLNKFNNQLEQQFKDLHSAGRLQSYVFEAYPNMEYPYPFNFSQEQALMILSDDKEQLNEYLLSKDLLDYHMKELSLFQESKGLTDDDRDSINYMRQDYLLHRVLEE